MTTIRFRSGATLAANTDHHRAANQDSGAAAEPGVRRNAEQLFLVPDRAEMSPCLLNGRDRSVGLTDRSANRIAATDDCHRLVLPVRELDRDAPQLGFERALCRL